jgi:hypothetical protein
VLEQQFERSLSNPTLLLRSNRGRGGREADIVLEPVRRDSARAIAAATEIAASLGMLLHWPRITL